MRGMLDSRNTGTLIVRGAVIHARSEGVSGHSGEVVPVVVHTALDIEVACRADVRGAIAVHGALARRRGVLLRGPNRIVPGTQLRDTALEVAGAVSPRNGLAVCVFVAGGETALKGAGPFQPTVARKVRAVVVPTAGYGVLHVGGELEGELAAGGCADAGVNLDGHQADGDGGDAGGG